MEQLDLESQQCKDVYAHYGAAMYAGQCLEKQLVIMLATIDRQAAPTIELWDELFSRHFKKTLGTLIERIRRKVEVSDEIENRLGEALRLRNYLAHDYFWYRAAAFVSEDGRLAMTDELQRFRNFLMGIDQVLTDIGRRWSQAVGVTEEDRREALREILESRTIQYPLPGDIPPADLR